MHRAQTLFKLVGLTTGIRKLSMKYASFQPDLTYWLDSYEIARIATPSEYPLLQKRKIVGQGQIAVRVEVDGGVQLAPTDRRTSGRVFDRVARYRDRLSS